MKEYGIWYGKEIIFERFSPSQWIIVIDIDRLPDLSNNLILIKSRLIDGSMNLIAFSVLDIILKCFIKYCQEILAL